MCDNPNSVILYNRSWPLVCNFFLARLCSRIWPREPRLCRNCPSARGSGLGSWCYSSSFERPPQRPGFGPSTSKQCYAGSPANTALAFCVAITIYSPAFLWSKFVSSEYLDSRHSIFWPHSRSPSYSSQVYPLNHLLCMLVCVYLDYRGTTLLSIRITISHPHRTPPGLVYRYRLLCIALP